ncbi:stage II sporulation protein R [Clostridium ihumii]|uniref:stage II sporulation protein R n=1 Tax=Clostridium ihumii TaxID=1470356 RepID=UPI000557A422|nr:stage II sporulation protein R [Clostridium ihumii]
MKKVIASVLLGTIVLGSTITYGMNRIAKPSMEDISEKLIRFHVIANSDSEGDQAVKLKVRDEVLRYISPRLKEAKSINESREIIKNEDENLIKIAKKTLIENGYDYKLESTLSKEYFPVKTYGNITLPQGKYEAYRIIIGEGQGHNWWCVMFPPLCFVDVSKGQISYNETEKEMKEVLTEKEYNMVDNTKKNVDKNSKIVDNSEDNNIVLKSKAAETIKKILNK